MNGFLRGERIYGDDFGIDEIQKWFDDEREGYAELYGEVSLTYEYEALNRFHGFGRIPSNGRLCDLLSIGGAYGDELLPATSVATRRIAIVEPSEALRRNDLNGLPVEYAQPQADGKLPFDDDSFDLVTCFGTLHHIPNVTAVLGEMHRCVRAGGLALVREPITSMGDWRSPRVGLTKRERGIPVKLFRAAILKAGFEIKRERLCMFSLSRRLGFLAPGGHVYNSPFLVRIDAAVCKAFSWNTRYHRTTIPQKLGPTCIAFLLRKP
jgi:SAM-dependent methyltransferase